MTRDDIGKLLKDGGIGVEVGVEYGLNAEVLLKTSRLSVLYLVDPWDYIEESDPIGFDSRPIDWENVYESCKSRMAQFGDRARMMVMPSRNASKMFDDASLDFVYIDGNHMSPNIDNDLKMWFPKIKSGGIFAGHDYYDRHTEGVWKCDVKTAVDSFFDSPVTLIPDEVPSWLMKVK